MKTFAKIVVALSFALSAVGCEKTGCNFDAGGRGAAVKENEASKPPIAEPIEYLPMAKGTTFTYEIELGETEPLIYKLTYWPRGDGEIGMITRGRYVKAMLDGDESDATARKKLRDKRFILKLRVKGLAEKQGGLKYPVGVELTVEKDELGVYEEADKVFWAATRSGGFTCYEVVTYPPNSIGSLSNDPWGGWRGEDGYSMSVFFFGRKPGTAISLGSKNEDALLFQGEDFLPGTRASSLHFIREVDPAGDGGEKQVPTNSAVLDKGFKEDRYFVKDRGLVYLRQTVEGKTSMTWTRLD